MSQGIGYVYHTLVLPCGTSLLLYRHGRVRGYRSKGPHWILDWGHIKNFKSL